MNNKLTIFIRIAISFFLSIALIQVFAGIAPVFRNNFPTYAATILSVLLVTFLPNILKRFNMELSSGVYYSLIVTTLLSLVGGYGFSLYRVLPHYDTAIHFMNGAIITFIGFAIIRYVVNDKEANVLRMIIVAFFLSMTVGMFWEIYEFFVDVFTGRNMQRYEDVLTGRQFVGQEALYDTMVDLIVDALGGIVAAIVLFRSQLRDGKIVELFNIKRIDECLSE